MKTEHNPNFENRRFSELIKVHQVRSEHNLVKLGFQFYAMHDLKAEDFAEELEKLGYEVEVDATGRKCDCTRVYGTTAFLVDDGTDFIEWYRAIKDAAWYYECDFSHYSLKKNETSFDELLNVKQAINEKMLEERTESQVGAAPLFLEMYHLHGSTNEDMRLDYFFYSNDKSKAEDLAEALKKLLYTVDISETKSDGKKYSICGQTTTMKDDQESMEKWVAQMNELGYIHDCEFDGWGSVVPEGESKGGWFSDDTPDEEVRKRLGLPPREEEY